MDRAAIKAQARELNRGNTFGLFLLLLVVGILGGGIYSTLYMSGDFIRTIINIGDSPFAQRFASSFAGGYLGTTGIISLILGILMVPVSVAVTGYFVRFIRTRRSSAGEGISFAFKDGFAHFGRYFAVRFVTYLIIFLWALIPIFGWVMAFCLFYRYSFVGQIICDNPNLTGKQARALSKAITNHRVGELFVLELSFFFWVCLSAITLGLSLIYVMPYINTTQALYYENLRLHALQAGLIDPQQLGTVPYEEPNYYDANVPFAQGAGVPQQPMNGFMPQQQPTGANAGQPFNATPAQPPMYNQSATQNAPVPQAEDGVIEHTIIPPSNSATKEEPTVQESPIDITNE